MVEWKLRRIASEIQVAASLNMKVLVWRFSERCKIYSGEIMQSIFMFILFVCDAATSECLFTTWPRANFVRIKIFRVSADYRDGILIVWNLWKQVTCLSSLMGEYYWAIRGKKKRNSPFPILLTSSSLFEVTRWVNVRGSSSCTISRHESVT